MPPDASERDAAKRDAALDDVLRGDDIRFVTGKVDETERAAVIAVLTQVRAEESDQVKRVARRDREPWARSQRVPDSIYDLLADA
nr:acyl-CoA carboxylase epsilon subunit [Leucobacter sp. L43]